MLPVYAALLISLIRSISHNNSSRLFASLGIALALLGLVLSLFMPVPELPKVTGNQSIYVDYLYVPDNTEQAEIPLKIWFPGGPSQVTTPINSATWHAKLEQLGPVLSARAGMPDFAFNHLRHFVSGQKASIANTVTTNKPIIVLIHGRGGFKELNSFMATELASHGYIVIAPDIPKGAMLTILENGQTIPFNPALFADDKEYSDEESYAIIQKLGVNWQSIVARTIAYFQEEYPRLDTNNVIVGGHSTGAAAAINYCDETTNCLGVIALDAWMKPVKESILLNGSKKPILALFGDQQSGDFEPINQERYRQMEKASLSQSMDVEFIEIKHARHIDFCDAALFSPYSYLLGQQKGKIDTHDVMQVINRESLRFIQQLESD